MEVNVTNITTIFFNPPPLPRANNEIKRGEKKPGMKILVRYLSNTELPLHSSDDSIPIDLQIF